jgi:hypothetical protein
VKAAGLAALSNEWQRSWAGRLLVGCNSIEAEQSPIEKAIDEIYDFLAAAEGISQSRHSDASRRR